MVGGLGLRPDGDLIVVDDPALLDPAEPMGTGRMFVVRQAGRARDRRPGSTKDRTPTFTVAGDGDARCASSVPLTGSGVDTGWDDCAGDGTLHRRQRPRRRRATSSPSARPTAASPAGRRRSASRSTTWRRWRPRSPSPPTAAPTAKVGTTRGSSSPPRRAPRSSASSTTRGVHCRARPGPHPHVHRRRAHASSSAPPTAPATSPRSRPGVHGRRHRPPRRPRAVGPRPRHPPRLEPLRRRPAHLRGLDRRPGRPRLGLRPQRRLLPRDRARRRTVPARSTTPRSPVRPGPRTCLGGLLPEAGTGPDAAGQPVARRPDPAPARQRRRDRPHPRRRRPELGRRPGQVEPRHRAVRVPGHRPDDRRAPAASTATAAGPDGEVYVVFQDSGTVERIANPAGANPPWSIVGRRPAAVAPRPSPPAVTPTVAPPSSSRGRRPHVARAQRGQPPPAARRRFALAATPARSAP